MHGRREATHKVAECQGSVAMNSMWGSGGYHRAMKVVLVAEKVESLKAGVGEELRWWTEVRASAASNSRDVSVVSGCTQGGDEGAWSCLDRGLGLS